MNWSIHTESELDKIAQALIELSASYPIVLFEGEMGVGKTTLIKRFCALKQVEGVVNSPTFSLVNEYHTAAGERLYHFDLYRVESAEELLDFGFEDYIDSGDICLIEWPQIGVRLLPEKVIRVHLKEEEGTRHISVDKTS